MVVTTPLRSRALFESGFFCAESVLLAIAESKGIQSELIPKIATGFCSGISRTCGICGAVSGAILAVSLFYGRGKPQESVDPTYRAVRELIDRFGRKFGSTNCRDLIGCDLGTEEGRTTFKASNLIEQCESYTEEATRIAVSLIQL